MMLEDEELHDESELKQNDSGKRGMVHKNQGEKPITVWWKLWTFRLLSLIVIPALFFILIEISLRVFGFGYPGSAIIKSNLNGKKVCISNVKFGWRFSPKNIARETDSFVFDQNKSINTYRIFVLGGSAAMGVPDSSYGFSRILDVMLKDRYPGVEFEIINAAMPAINSHAVLPISKDCSDYEPDLFILYMGNNEVMGSYGVGSVFSPVFSSLSAIRASVLVNSTRTGQMLKSLKGSIASKDQPKTWDGLMGLENQIHYDSSALEKMYSHFQANLEDICDTLFASGAKTILCTVGMNVKDCPPLGSLHRLDINNDELEEWQEIYQKGIQFENEGRYSEALKQYLLAMEIDDHFAELHFRAGRCYSALEDHIKAKSSYEDSLERDTLRFRADKRINQIIRSVGKKKKSKATYLVDVYETLESQSSNQIPDNDIFWEHVHFNFNGNYVVACELFGEIEQLFPDRITRKKSNGVLLSQRECEDRLAYTGWDRYKIAERVLYGDIKRPPFTNWVYHESYVKKLEKKLQSLNDWRIHWKYGRFLDSAIGNYNSAETEYRLILSLIPDCYTYSKLGRVLYRQGRYDEAFKVFERALEIKPTLAVGYFGMAQIYRAQTKLDDAVKYYGKAIEIDPKISVMAYNNMATSLESLGRFNEAEQILQEAIISFPEKPDPHYLLGVFLERRGYTQKAISKYKTALEIDPKSTLALSNLAGLYRSQGKLQEADDCYRKVLEFNPRNLNAHEFLSDFLVQQKNIPEALEHCYYILKLKPQKIGTLNKTAWLLATTPDPDILNPSKAVELAQRACKLTNYERPLLLDTLAVAFAAAGEFDKAVETAEKAIQLADAGDNKILAERIQDRLVLYRQNRPYQSHELSSE